MLKSDGIAKQKFLMSSKWSEEVISKIKQTALAFFASTAVAGCGGDESDPPASQQAQLPQTTISLAAIPITIGRMSEGVQISWPDRSTASGGKGESVNGVNCLVNESYHIHTHLTIIRDGITQRIPKDVGLTGCAYELHTHDSTGVIHVETNMEKKFTLGQFFAVWGQPLSITNVAGINSSEIAFYVVQGGQLNRVYNDPTEIVFKNHDSIVIVIGTMPKELPSYAWPAGL